MLGSWRNITPKALSDTNRYLINQTGLAYVQALMKNALNIRNQMVFVNQVLQILLRS